MLIDYHLHTPYCGHAHGKTIEYIERAIVLGMEEICFTDHLGRYYLTHVQRRRYWDWGMDERTIQRYVAELTELQELYKERIRIRIGLEIDFIEGAEELLAPFLEFYTFDFLLCSVHCLPKFGWRHLSDYHDFDGEAVFREYFRYARAALASGHFHALAHPDFSWRYLKWPQIDLMELLEGEIIATVAAAVEHDVCLEVNANGFMWSYTNIREGVDPFLLLIGECVKQGAKLTIGSDAHDPAMVGKTFTDLVPVLRSWGVREVAVFEKGRRSLVPLG